jgi:hypothetical protein
MQHYCIFSVYIINIVLLLTFVSVFLNFNDFLISA